MRIRMEILVICAIACFTLGIAGCGENDTSQNVGDKMGKGINRTIESAKDAVHAAHSAAESTAESAKDALHDATK